MKKILIIYTGGTIGMVHDSRTGALKPFDFKRLLDHVPELRRFNYTIESISFTPLMDSSNIEPGTWIKLANIIAKAYNEYDGFVILHGTDTMAYTASALSFMLENLGKPVIFTGAQLPIGKIRTDAKENLITAIEIAASGNKKSPAVPEVCIFFDYQLLRGNRSIKYSSEKFEAFRSVNYPPLAEAGVNIRFNHSAISKMLPGKLKLHTSLSNNIAVLKIYPGMPYSFINSVLSSPGLKAVVMETFGTGNAPTDNNFLSALKKAIDKNIIIYNITQCPGGAVAQGLYETSIQLKEIGVIPGGDITTEAAVAKLMFLLGQKFALKEIRKLLQQSLRGEMSEVSASGRKSYF